jgi:hypothetical protein
MVPASGGGLPLHGPQTPAALPAAMTQDEPAQQSALLVHAPQVGTQELPVAQT